MKSAFHQVYQDKLIFQFCIYYLTVSVGKTATSSAGGPEFNLRCSWVCSSCLKMKERAALAAGTGPAQTNCENMSGITVQWVGAVCCNSAKKRHINVLTFNAIIAISVLVPLIVISA
jgi:hypothetical protein